MRKLTLPQILVAIGAFLIPLLGGQISTDQAMPVEPGLGALLRAMLGGPLLQGFEVPLFSHLAIMVPIALGLALSLGQRSVIQLPNIRLMGLIVAFFGLLFISTGLSAFKFVSMAALAEWLTYALALFACVAVLGRDVGPRVVLTSLFVGICCLALYGIGVEYQQMRATDPNVRIFAGWVNPNATAGIFSIGIAIGTPILLLADRVPKLLVSIGLTLISTALLMTGSKAGIAAAVGAVITFAILGFLWLPSGKPKVLRAMTGIVVIAVGFALFNAIQLSNRKESGAAGPSIGRIGSFESEQAQSLGFRKLLWQGSLELTKARPVGYGVGTYRFEGSRPGLTTQTQLAHNNILQLAVEASWLSAALFLAIIGWWIWIVFRGAKRMPETANLLKAGVVAAIAGTFAHGMFESNLYYYGIGLTFFLLLGIGLCLSADSVLPEFTPATARTGLVALCTIPLVMLAYFGWAEWQRSLIGHAIDQRDFDRARELTINLTSKAPMDGEAWNLRFALDPQERGASILNASNAMPAPRILRNWAKFEQQEGKAAEADTAIQAALERDPNNLNTLKLALEIAREFKEDIKAREIAERMVQVESTPYYTIRALPQIIETATAEARIYLADQTASNQERASQLSKALDILRQYAAVTVPEVKRMSTAGLDYGPESVEKALGICQLGIATARKLKATYRALGDSARADEAAESVSEFEAAATSLGGSK